MKEKLENLIRQALEELGIEDPQVSLEHPTDTSHGDYSTNAALIYSKQIKNPPPGGSRQVADQILQYIVRNKPQEIEKVEVAGPGFVNFYLSKKFFIDSVEEVLEKKDQYGKNNNLVSQKIILEYTQPNPFKEFHIGHLVNNIVGEAISRVVQSQGATVKRVTYHGDVGLHVAKTIWALKKKISLNNKSLR